MKIPSKFSLALLAGTILSTPATATAATLTPTLDTIKAEAADLSGSYELMEPVIPPALADLPEDEIMAYVKLIANNPYYLDILPDEYREAFASILPENSILVEIDNKMYYFALSDNDATLLKTLAGMPAANLKEDENGIFEFGGKKYGFDVAAIPSSVFEYAEGTAEDYNFTMQEADAEGNLTTKYYKVVLKPETFTTSESIKWMKVGEEHKDDKDNDLSDGKISAVVSVNLPNNQTRYFQYTYTKPDNYTITNTRIDDILSSANATNVVFTGISAGFHIRNNSNIKADFIGNYTQSTDSYASGGAIDNYVYMSYVTTGDITGDFIENYVISTYSSAAGGAIYNEGKSGTVTIGDITGDFIGNYAQGKYGAAGGVIYNAEHDAIGDITGDFIGNYTQSTDSSTEGGAIYNDGTIGNIIGDFIGNYASGSNGGAGGAIGNVGIIGDITGDFIGNYAISTDGYALGGAIVNGGIIGDITGDFIGNYAQNGSGQALGGAIVNQLGNFNITGNILNNYAQSEKGTAYGGAFLSTIGLDMNTLEVTASSVSSKVYGRYPR